MNPNPFLGVLYHWTGGLSAASCYLPFRGIRRWSWEIYWLVQGWFSWIVAPLVFAGLLVPELVRILHGADGRTLFYTWFWGAMWGIGGLLFGLGVRYLGIALGYTIALGFSTVCGTLVPPLFAGELGAIARDRAGQVILLGVAVCVAAIVVSGIAGRMKERELAGGRAMEAASPGGRGEYAFGRGVLVASFAGILSACFAYGLAAGKPIIPVGTTSARTIESLYWLGVKLIADPAVVDADLVVRQWDPYERGADIRPEAALTALLEWMSERGLSQLVTHTQLLITPGYTWRVARGLITNFHQPGSTLLLLIASLVGEDWRAIYAYALEHGFRFLSYGDGCLLLPG